MSLNQSLNISVSSMKNYQYALAVVSHNMANLYTDGYHRQRVNFVENAYTADANNVLATIRGLNGASISSLTSYMDKGAFDNLINSNSDAQYYNSLVDSLGDLEDIADDLGDSGLNALLNDFYTAVANLEQFPTDLAVRRQFVMAAQNVCDKFNQISQKCDSLQNDKSNEISNSVDVVNKLFAELADCNNEYLQNPQNSQVLSRRDEILAQLSDYMDVKTSTNSNGTLNLYVGDVAVVQGSTQQYKLRAEFGEDGAKLSLQSTLDGSVILENGITEAFSSGSIKAQIDFLNGTNGSYTNLNNIRSALDSAANAFAQALNEIQTYDNGDVFAASITSGDNGELKLEKSTEELIKTKDGSGTVNAGNIAINEKMLENPYLVAAARIDKTKFEGDEWTKAIGNSDNAVEFSALQNKKICTYDSGVKATLQEFLNYNAAKNAMDLNDLISKADTYNAIRDDAATNYSNIIGVNLDEELADMIKFQRAYEASARLFTTINDLYGTIINMV